ncbi:hypothetical protein AcW1_006028 [Taiwanofungus camphoratus]|nr:hypothetical protein AcW1_006028 [Antrodia cinnamomea]
MLSICTSESLVLIDPATLKRAPSSVSPTCQLASSPSCLTWSPDNTSVFVSSLSDIHQYDSFGNLVKVVYTCPPGFPGQPITAIVSKDRGSIAIFSKSQQVIVLEVRSGKTSQIFDTHKALVTSLALSNDGSLLASTSANAVHVHNLSHGSHTSLRGLPAAVGNITTCAFHPHTRTRLLIGAGQHLLVYDTTRPSRPIKAVAVVDERDSSGEVVAIASSPFSKTLVAVACSGGLVSLLDLEKDNSIYRTISLHVPLTSLVFSPEGATLYAGTENGKLILKDLRPLEKEPKSITVSDRGDRIVAMCIQKKLKPEEAAIKADGTAVSKPLTQQDVNKNPSRRAAIAGATGPEKVVKARVASGGTTRPARTSSTDGTTAVSPAGRTKGARKGAAKSPGARKISSGGITKKVFSPPKSPLARAGAGVPENEEGLDVSVRIESLLALPQTNRLKENLKPVEDVVISGSTPNFSATSSRADVRKLRTTSISQASVSPSAAASRVRSASGASVGAMSSASTAGRASKSYNRPSSKSQSVSPVPPIPAMPAAYQHNTPMRLSRTLSPELPDLNVGAPVTPVPLGRGKGKEKMARMGVLGLGTPDVERWVRAGEATDPDDECHERKDGKKVGFAREKESDEEDSIGHSEGETDGVAGGRGLVDREPVTKSGLAMQISPRRPLPSTSTSWAPVPSPLRNPSNTYPGSPQAKAAHDLLQSLLRDALCDFRQETHAEMVGLHLDLVRMGRGWKREMRLAMEEFGGEIKALREENERLREENERLKRGY